jgi:NAD+ synthase
MKNLANEIVAWLKDYAEKSNRKAWVVGVSGGVDSSLVSTLCAMTKLPTHCVVLPCHSSLEHTESGFKHIRWLKDKFENDCIYRHFNDLTGTFNVFKDEFEPYGECELADANTKSRLRMTALYHIATIYGGLVVGTGNKVEDYGLGFCTKGGDSCVDISPIADLLKSEVRQMCRELGVLPELCEAIPTDGLWEDGRTDEQAIGATYDEIEWAMSWRYTTAESSSFLTDRQKEVLAIYDKWHKTTRHKFDPIPCFIRKHQCF